MKRLLLTIVVASFVLQSLFIFDGEAINSEDTVLEGWVRDWSWKPMPNITVEALIGGNVSHRSTTDSSGHYRMAYMDGFTNYTIRFHSDWTSNFTTNVIMTLDATTYLNVSVEYQPVGGVEGHVKLPDGSPAYRVGVHYYGEGVAPQFVFTDILGYYAFNIVQEGTCELEFELGGYETLILPNITVLPHQWNRQNAILTLVPFDVSILPIDGELDVPVNATIMVEFQREIDINTVDGSTMILINQQTGSLIPAFIEVGATSKTFYLLPEENLIHETFYMVHLTTDISDIWGKDLPYNITSYFRTEIFFESVTVQNIYPGKDSREIPVDIQIIVDFKTGLDPMMIDTSTFLLYKSPDTLDPIPCRVNYHVEQMMAILIPDEPLDHETRYTVSLTEDIDYEDPTKIFKGESWSFETGPPPVTTATVLGYVLDDTNTPILSTNAVVRLENNKRAYAQYPDPNGRFVFHDIPPGTYNLTVKAEGYEFEYRTVYIDLGDPVAVDTIRLKPKNGDLDGATSSIMTSFIVVITLSLFIIVVIYIVAKRSNGKTSVDEKTIKDRPPAPPTARKKHQVIHHEIRSVDDDPEDNEMEDVIMDELIEREIRNREAKKKIEEKPRVLEAPPGM